MALEDPAEGDLKIEAEGYRFLIGDGLEDRYDKFTIDYNNSTLRRGFVILPNKS